MNAPRGFKEALSVLGTAKATIDNACMVAAEAYCTTKWRAQPIVAHHFTRGNVERYGWAQLKEQTLAGKVGKATAANAAAKAKGWRATGTDKAQGARTLPVLVRSGKLRNVIEQEGKIVRESAERVKIVWNAPDYAHWHHVGGTMHNRPPKRSPVEPNAEDDAEVRQVLLQFIEQALGSGRTRST